MFFFYNVKKIINAMQSFAQSDFLPYLRHRITIKSMM